MAARYATESFVLQLASGTSIHVAAGSLRDSLSPIVTAAPGMFTTVAPVGGVGKISGRLAAHLALYPQGEEVS